MNIAKAQIKNVRISPRKMRLLADSLAGKSIHDALMSLTLTDKRGASVLMKLVKSAVSNAVSSKGLKEEALEIQTIQIGDGQALKRFRPSTRGRVHPYKKRASNVTVIVVEKGAMVANSK